MTPTLPLAAEPPTPTPSPLFRRTVDRQLVHRSALSEVFLTDLQRSGPDAFVAAAQTPSSHAYFGDALGHGLADALLLMECVRQAETCGGHLVFGVEHGRKFVLLDWSLQLTPPGMRVQPGRPAELVIATIGEDVRRLGDEVHGMVFRMTLSSGGAVVGNAHIRVGYLWDEAYKQVRLRHRDDPPPSSLTIQPAADGDPVAPRLVARADPANVVLFDASRGTNELTARIRPPVGHPSMFDHPQDHLPGMTLVEAGRQACLLALHDVNEADSTAHVLTAFDTGFTSYAELDAPVLVRVRPQPAPSGGQHYFAVDFLQDTRVTAAGTMTFSPVWAMSTQQAG